jgi:hypothetical protein
MTATAADPPTIHRKKTSPRYCSNIAILLIQRAEGATLSVCTIAFG